MDYVDTCPSKKKKNKDNEKIIIKIFPYLKQNYFEDIFFHLFKIQKISRETGLLKLKGYSVEELYTDSFNLLLIYPYIEYNLNAILK